MGKSWDFHRISMIFVVFPWFSHGFPMIFAWFSSMVFPWLNHPQKLLHRGSSPWRRSVPPEGRCLGDFEKKGGTQRCPQHTNMSNMHYIISIYIYNITIYIYICVCILCIYIYICNIYIICISIQKRCGYTYMHSKNKFLHFLLTILPFNWGIPHQNGSHKDRLVCRMEM